MAPASSLPCIRDNSATCGLGRPESRVVTPAIPPLPSIHDAISGAARRTLKSGSRPGGVKGPIARLGSRKQPVGRAPDKTIAGLQFGLRDPLVRLMCLRDM